VSRGWAAYSAAPSFARTTDEGNGNGQKSAQWLHGQIARSYGREHCRAGFDKHGHGPGLPGTPDHYHCASPDGYTLSIGNITTHVFNGAIYPLPYDLLKDFEPIAMVASNPQLLLGKPDISANTLQELIAWIKARPGAVLIGTTGNGSSPHISGVYLKRTLGIPATMVPFRGAAPALQALMAGQIDILFDQESNALPQVRAKTVKVYAVTAKNPSAAAPDISTVDAAGLPGFYMAVWHGLWAPKGTPADVITKLNAAVVDALADPGVRARLAELGQEIPALDQQSPQALGVFQKAEIEKWWPLIRADNIKEE
jgi:tripartite-type tricarboxylate transporter receptor subunit TctC